MRQSTTSIFTPTGQPKYLNEKERQALENATLTLPLDEQLFCQTMIWTGCRISEALSLTRNNIALEEQMIVVRTLKKGDRIVMRSIPLPPDLAAALVQYSKGTGRLWPWGRTRAWKVVKRAMAKAGITGVRATPRAIRHTFAVRAVQHEVPITLVQRWLGHSKLTSTAIYTHVVGQEEVEFAARTWR